VSELLALPLADNRRARQLHADASYSLPALAKNEKPRRSQFEFIELARNGRQRPAKPGRGRPRYPAVKPAKRPF